MKKHSIFFILILSSLFLGSCKYDYILPEVVAPVNDVKFSTQIAPIFAEKCVACHNRQTPVLTADVAYSQLVPNYVNTTSPESSKIYVVPSSGKHYAKISAAQAALILQWIKEGAKNN
ncbi:MAG: hypothetical protein ACM3P1_00115 [Candidatus Saccharibacteria bacterium]